MKTHEQNTEETTGFVIEELEHRLTPTVALDVLGLVTLDVHLDLQLNVTTPVGANVDLALTL
jgi:hypothetical protein